MTKGFIVIGDTHGNHKLIIHRVKSLHLEGETLFHVGDFGVGFAKTEHEDIERMAELNKILKKHNCHLYVIRGNHDNPEFFKGNHDYSNLHLLPDYSVIEVNGEKVLMVGGAISVDRRPRKDDMQKYRAMGSDYSTYWYDEGFVLDKDKLESISDINYVITHSCPKFVFPINDQSNAVDSHGPFVQRFAWNDYGLKDDLNKERNDLTEMWEMLNKNNYIKKWFYGHFHTSKQELVDGTDFILLNCDEFYNVTQQTQEDEKTTNDADADADTGV